MTQVADIDFNNKRLILHADTVFEGFDCFLAYDEIRARYAANLNDERKRNFFLEKEGFVSKGSGKFTPKFGLMDSGWRIVPYAGVSHQLLIKVEIVSHDQISDRDVFDRSSLVVNVDIDSDYQQTEVIEVSSGSGLSAEQAIQLSSLLTKVSTQEILIDELWKLAGLDPINSKQIQDGQITVGSITLTIDNPDTDTTEVSRS